MRPPTPDQQLAITARGNVLVEAGAGSGKTHTLVQRCLSRVLDPDEPVSLERILMVTFTEAAAAEMRKRIAGELSRIRNAPEQLPGQWADVDALISWLDEQLALLDQARISTLHSFCLELIREHFHELGLDPSLVVMDEAQAALLGSETIGAMLDRHYNDGSPAGEAVRELIRSHGGGEDAHIRELVLRTHRYMRSLDDPGGWLDTQAGLFEATHPEPWRSRLPVELGSWKREWIEVLMTASEENLHAATCRSILESFDISTTYAGIASVMESILAVRDSDWNRRKTKDEPILKALFKDAAFLHPLFVSNSDKHEQRTAAPVGLEEDWAWVRKPMGTLLRLVREFDEAYANAKRERGALDFADLEQFALKVLWERGTGEPTPASIDWRARLEMVFVDEYQDINAAQDRILACVSRDGSGANRFLVGDVKQSIYRFRLANPHIFQAYAGAWRLPGSPGQVITLADNFRSHEAILEFINRLFAGFMKPSVGGVSYDANARLKFGGSEERAAMAMLPEQEGTADPQGARVEVLIRKSGEAQQSASEEEDESVSNSEAEARMIAARLKELRQSGFEVVEGGGGVKRPVQWRDMVVLLRSPGTRGETYAREFARQGLPLEVSRGGFYDRTEVSDLVNLLCILDNPLQDIPLLAVLRSPLVGLTLDEMAVVRMAARPCHYWEALQRFYVDLSTFQAGFPDTPAVLDAARSAHPKVHRFLEQYRRWRHLARQGSLANCLESVLAETLYEEWLKGMPRGGQSTANVRRLCATARRFDQFQRQGLYRFLNYVEETRRSGAKDEIAPAPDTDSIRLMSIHQSKGQEFPVVVVAGLGTRFNMKDLQKEVILDESLGLCPMVHPPDRPVRYPSPGYWMAVRHQRRELLGEEIRLLYVALTRARDKLLLTATVSGKDVERFTTTTRELEDAAVASAARMVDWVGPLLGGIIDLAEWCTQENGRKEWLSWSITAETADITHKPDATDTAGVEIVDATEVEEVASRLSWAYPHEAATVLPAKTTVTEARRRLVNADEDSAPIFQPRWPQQPAPTPAAFGGNKLSAAETGIAHHAFLEHVNLASTGTSEQLREEVRRLVECGLLASEQAAVLDIAALECFWRSSVGASIRAHADRVHREMPFTARVSPSEAGLGAGVGGEEFVVVQGVVDLAVVLDDEIWIVDFKTDSITTADLPAKEAAYKPQLRLYASALEKLLGKPATRVWLHFLQANHTSEAQGRPG